MSGVLRQSTAAAISFGPFLSPTDGVTLQTGLVSAIDHASTGIFLSKNGAALTIRHATITASTYDAYGNYIVTLDTTDTGTVGRLRVQFAAAASCLPVWRDYDVISQAVYDALFANAAPGYLQPTVATRTLDVSATGEAGIDWANVGAPTTSLALTGTTIATTQKVDIETIKTRAVTAAGAITVLASVGTASTDTAQTGDSYARLGSPAGASVSADIAAAKVDTAAVKVKTDFLPSATAGAAGGVFIAGSNAATSITTALTANVIGNVTGNLSGSVGSVTGNVGGNVVGSVASVTATVAANLTQILGTALTETAGLLAGGFKKFFNIATPAATMDHGVLVDTVTTTTTATNLTNLPTVPTDWLAAAGVKADAVTKIQNGLATPTNITAGTITTVTNLTNAPSAGDFTATMKTSLNAATPAVTLADGAITAAKIAADAITAAKIADGAIDAATFAAGAINAAAIAADAITDAKVASDVTIASVTGAVGSVTGAVGSVTGNIGGNVTGSIGSLAAQAKADVNAEADTALADVGVTVTVTGRIDAAITTRASQTSVDTIDDFVDTEVAAIKTVTDRLNSTLESVGSPTDYRFTAAALVTAPSGGGSVPTAAQVADAVWDEAISGHQGAGSTGLALSDAGSAGNPWNNTAEGALTFGDLVRIQAGVAAGKTTITDQGGGNAVVKFRTVSDDADIVTAQMSGSQRAAVTLNP